jgi:hypothetical protein
MARFDRLPLGIQFLLILLIAIAFTGTLIKVLELHL